MSETVLLTGISGYVGLHCAKQLLDAGYSVRGSVRSKSKEKEAYDTLRDASTDVSKLSFAYLDLTSDDGWNEAIKGCDYLMHVASPFVVANPKNEQELITPAVEGTKRALRAAHEAGVKRVVLTSSIVAMMGVKKTGTYGPSDWADVNAPDLNTYSKSKTLAERAAWDFVSELSDDKALDLVVINPGTIFGPPLGKDISGESMATADKMLRGKMPLVPKMSFTYVDVRDLAELHVKALTQAGAVGKRFVAALAEPMSYVSIAQYLKELGYDGPSTRLAPNFLIRFASLFDREAKGALGFLNLELYAENEATLQVFDWKPRSIKQSVKDTAEVLTTLR